MSINLINIKLEIESSDYKMTLSGDQSFVGFAKIGEEFALFLLRNAMNVSFFTFTFDDHPEAFEYKDNMDNTTTGTINTCYSITNMTGGNIKIGTFLHGGGITIGDLVPEITLDNNEITYLFVDENSQITDFTNIACCLHPLTNILTNLGYKYIKDIESNQELKLKDIYGNFIDLIYNIKYIPSKDFILISKNAFGNNKPSDDLYIKEGHPLHLNNKEINCEDLINNKTIHKVQLDDPVFLYSLCTKERTAVIMNNLLVYTWSQEDWESYATINNIIWFKQ